MAANASKTRGLFGGVGNFFRARYRGAKEVVGGVGSGTKKYLYTKPGQFFTGGAARNTVYNNANPKVPKRNMRKIAEVLALLEPHALGITAEFKKRGKGTLTEFITALNSNRNGGRRNTTINASNPSLNHYAENAFRNYQTRQGNSEKKKLNNQSARSAIAAKAAANRNKARRNRQLQSLFNNVINNSNNPNSTVSVRISNNNRKNIINTIEGARNAYSKYMANTKATSLKGFVAYLNTGRTGNARNLSKMTLLEEAVKNALADKTLRNEAKKAKNASNAAAQKARMNARKARLTGTPAPPPPPPPPPMNAKDASKVARAASEVARAALEVTPNTLLKNNALIARSAAKNATTAAELSTVARRNGISALANSAERLANESATVAVNAASQNVLPSPTQALARRLNPRNRVGPLGGGGGGGFGSTFGGGLNATTRNRT